MTEIKDIIDILEEFERSPESVGMDLRLDLADLIIKHIDDKGWTQKKLANITGMQEPFISRIVNAESNCTFDVAGRILHALGIKAELTKIPDAYHLCYKKDIVYNNPQFRLASYTTTGDTYDPKNKKEGYNQKNTSEIKIKVG